MKTRTWQLGADKTRESDGRPRILLVISSGFTQEQFDETRDSTPEAELIAATDETVYDKSGGIHALIGCPRRAFTQELLSRTRPTLRWVHGSGAGVEEFLIPEFVETDVIFTNGKVIQGPEVADHAMALLLALARNLHLVFRREVDRPMPRPIELRGKRAVVVGLGGVGMLVAERAAAFGMNVVGVTAGNLPPMLSMLDRVYPPERLNEPLPDSDVVIVCAAHTPWTARIFGRKQFSLMKPSAYFINVSRGTLVDTDALVDALAEGRLAGVGLDVTDPEPLPDDHPLREFDNVIISPHIAGLSDHNRQRSFELVRTNIDRFVKGQPLLNIVDKNLGY